MSIRKRIIILLSALMMVSLGLLIVFSNQNKVFANSISASDINLFTDDSNAIISTSGFEVDTTEGKVGEINGIFSGDFEMDFSFTNSGFGSTEIAFYDKDDASTKVFSVVYTIKDSNVGAAFVFDYRDNSYHVVNESGSITGMHQWVADNFNIGYKNEAYPNTYYNSTVGKLGVAFSGDNVSITVSEGWAGEVTNNVQIATLAVSGLSDGYIVKIEGNSIYSNLGRNEGYDSIVVKAINGLDFTSDVSINAELNGQIIYDGEFKEGTKNIIEISEFEKLSSFYFLGNIEIDFSDASLGKFISNDDSRVSFNIDDTFEGKAVGSYDISVQFNDVQKNYTIRVEESDSCSPLDLFTLDSNVKKLEKGVGVNTLSNAVTINAILKGDFEIEFGFTKSGFSSNEIAFYSKFDLSKKVFSIVYTIKDGNVGSALVFDYENNNYYAFNESGSITSINQWTVDHFNIAYEKEVYPNNYHNNTAGKLGVYFDDGDVTVKVSEGWNNVVEGFVKLAELSFPSLADGYIVRIEKNSLFSNLSRNEGCDNLFISSLNGISFINNRLGCEIYEEQISHEDEYSEGDLFIIDTVEGKGIKEFNYITKFIIDCSGKGFVDFDCQNSITKFAMETNYQDKTFGEYSETVKYGAVEKNYLIRVKKGQLTKTEDIFASNDDIVYFEDVNNKGYAINTKNQDVLIGQYFHGDLEIEYAYTQNGYGATEFVFYDKDNPTVKVFSVLRTFNYNNNGTAFVVDYIKNKAVALDVESELSDVNVYYPWSVANADDKKEIYPNNAGNYSTVGKLGLFFDGNEVSIKVSQGWDGEITNYLTLATLNLPDFSDGYILKLEGSTIIREKGDDSILITAINGLELSRENLPSQVVSSFIKHEAEYLEGGKTYINIPLGSNITPFTFVNIVDISGLVVSVDNETFVATKLFNDKKVGEYNFIANYKGMSKNYVIKVFPAYETNNIFTEDSKASLISAGGNKGVRVKPYSQVATFNGQFNNDLEIEFAYGHSSYGTVRFDFYDKDNPNQIVFTIYRSFGIGRADKIEQGIVETTWGSAFVEYNGKFFALGQEFSNATDAVLYCQDQNISFYPVNNAKATDPHSFYTDKWNIPGKLILNWMGNSVEIKATIGEGDTVTGLQTLAILSLPDFKDGYTIKMTGQGYDSVHESEESILILGINGVRFDKEYTETSFYLDGLQYSSYMNQDGDIYVAKNGELGEFWCQKYYEYFTPRWQKSVIEDEEFIEEGFSVEYNVDLTSTGEKQVVVTPYLYGISGNPKIFTIIVEESAKIVFDCNGGVAIKDLYYSEHTFDFNLPFANKQDWKFGGWYNNGVLFEGFETFSSLTDITLKAHWYDNVGPEINLVDTVTEVLKVTEELQELAISSADVTVYDAATNKLFTEEEITVTIKVPGSNDYILLSDFVFDCKLYGTYFIKYSASDNWTSLGNIVNNANHSSNNVSEFIRIINYSAEKPVIIVGDNVPKIVYVGMNIVIPNAESKSGISVIDTIVSLTVESKAGDIVIIDITDNAKYELEGIYTLVYYAEDACGQITMEKYEITCVKDTNKPIIQVDVGVTQLEVGQRLTIPVATAYDAEFGSVNVTMELIFNGKVISTSNSVTLEQEGLYTIRYTAKDGANNVSIKEIDVIAIEVNNSGCSGNISSINGILIILTLASILLIIKRKKYGRR